MSCVGRIACQALAEFGLIILTYGSEKNPFLDQAFRSTNYERDLRKYKRDALTPERQYKLVLTSRALTPTTHQPSPYSHLLLLIKAASAEGNF